MLPNQTKTSWKDYVFSWPTYLIIGIALTEVVIQTEVLNPLIAKVWKTQKEEE